MRPSYLQSRFSSSKRSLFVISKPEEPLGATTCASLSATGRFKRQTRVKPDPPSPSTNAVDHHMTSRITAAVLILQRSRFQVESPNKNAMKMAILPLLPWCLLLPLPSIPGLRRVLRLFWDSGEAQMYSKDSIKGQGHPGHPLPSCHPPPPPPIPLAHLGFWRPASP